MTAAEARKRRALAVAVCAVLILAATHTSLWFIACKRLSDGATREAAAARADGWNISWSSAARSGWPLAAGIDFADIAIQGGPGQGITWTVPFVQLRISLHSPTEAELEAKGRQSIEAAGLAPVPFTTERFAVSVPLTGNLSPKATVARLSATVGAGTLTVRDAVIRFLPGAVMAELSGIALPGVQPEIDSLGGRADLTRPIPRAATPAARATLWREAGGFVALSNVSVRWGPLDAKGSFKAELDARLQPAAEGTLEASGLPAALDELARTGALPAGAATAAKAVVAILAAPAPAAPVRLPVTLRDGLLSVARFPLLRLPPLVWY